MPADQRRSTTAAQFGALALIWGASFLFIEIALQGMSPTQVVLGRLTAGALTLAVLSAVLRVPLPRGLLPWAHLGVLGMLMCLVPFLLFSWAQEDISSGLASIYNATTPLMTVLVAVVALPEERPTRVRTAGFVLGFLGVVLVLGPWHGLGGGTVLAQLACLGATACYGLGYVYMRRVVAPLGLAPLTVATGQVGIAAVAMAVLAPFVATAPMSLTPTIVASILTLGALGTGIAYAWNTSVVNAWGATRASTVTYLTPIVGVALGALVLHEAFTWNELVGAVVVVAAVALAQGRLTRSPGALRRRRARGAGGSSPPPRRTPPAARPS